MENQPGCLLSPGRQLTDEERSLVWRKPSSHKASAEERRIVGEVKRNWRRGEMKIANVLLEGDAGSGKTQLAKALSAEFGLPYVKITCFADMDKTDVIGAILPVIAPDRMNELSAEDRAAFQALQNEEGARSGSAILSAALGYSEAEASAVWKRLLRLAADNAPSDASVEYRFYPSEIVTAYRSGYLLEIQEPTVIRDAAVLMALNSALELDGSLNLPTEIIRRHPDFIAVITTNRGYAGVRPLNESLRDRVQHSEKMDLPDRGVMIERAVAKTGYRDLKMLALLADSIIALDQTAKANGIKGVAGMRSFFYWADAVLAGIPAREALYHKVIYKLTTDPEAIKLLEDALAGRGLLQAFEEADEDSKAASAKRASDDEAVEIKTWGAIDPAVGVDAAQAEPDDGQAIALKKSADSEEGSSGSSANEDSAGEEGDENGEDGTPMYREPKPANETPEKQDAKEKAREARKLLNREARDAVSESVHRDIKLIVHRPDFNAAMRAEYDELSGSLTPIIREIARQAMPLLEQEITAEFARNQAYGSKFQAESAVYRDFRTFARKKPPTESPSLAVALRIDESASMAAQGRLQAAKQAVIAVYEFCRMCGIPVLIYGDTADVSRLEQMSLFAYADFKDTDDNDCYRLMGMQARANNRDGMALRIIAEKLAAMPQHGKLLISISDGQPKAMPRYTGAEAMEDMSRTIGEYERKGVTFLAAAIGLDKGVIGDIYGNERYLDITELRELPVKLVNWIARHL